MEKILEAWKVDYNSFRPHSLLGDKAPSEVDNDINKRLQPVIFLN